MSLCDLYEQYGDRVQFLLVYIREAHPADGWRIGKQDIRAPQMLEERRKVASACEVALQPGIRTHVDEMDDAVMTAYAASWPERLYLVGTDGRVVHAVDAGRSSSGLPSSSVRSTSCLPRWTGHSGHCQGDKAQ